MNKVTANNSARDRLSAAARENLAKLGVQFKEVVTPVLDKDGKPVLDMNGNPRTYKSNTLVSISSDAREMLAALNDRVPCWFRGCAELRAQFKAEIGAQDCSGCSGATRRKYYALARKMLDADPGRNRPKLD